MRLCRVSEDDYAISLGDLDTLGVTAETGCAEDGLHFLAALVW